VTRPATRIQPGPGCRGRDRLIPAAFQRLFRRPLRVIRGWSYAKVKLVRAHPNAAVTMIAERAADRVRRG